MKTTKSASQDVSAEVVAAENVVPFPVFFEYGRLEPHLESLLRGIMRGEQRRKKRDKDDAEDQNEAGEALRAPQ